MPFGFVFSGVSGGISFLNANSDPCEIRSFINAETGKPIGNIPDAMAGLPWDQLKRLIEEARQRAEALAASVRPQASVGLASVRSQGADEAEPTSDSSPPSLRGGERATSVGVGDLEKTVSELTGINLHSESNELGIPCPGDCPPYTINIFCQPHPDQETHPGRVIVKFTSIEEATLNRFGITRERIASLLDQGVSSSGAIAQQIAADLRREIRENVKLPPAASRAEPLFNALFDTIENGFRSALAAALAGTPGAADAVYGKIRDVAYAAIPCQDVTYKVSGTFSHSAIGMFLSVTGEGLISTAGTAGVSGRVNFLGLPVGTGKVFIAGTDDQGDPNPSLCGEVKVALGPLEIGVLKAALKCDNCVSGVTGIFGNLIVGLSLETVQTILDRIAPQFRDVSPADLPRRLSPALQTAFLAALLEASANSLPGDTKQRFIDAVANSLTQFDPQFIMCGEVKPKLFGLPLGPDLVAGSYRVSKRGREGVVKFAPSALVCLILDPRFCAPVDSATLGYNEVFPNFDAAIIAGLDGTLLEPAKAAAFAKEQLRSLLENSTITTTYELAPMGLKLARAQGRAVMPDFTDHPLIRRGGWKRPEQIGLPSRTNLLQAMLRANLLGDPFWAGRVGDLPALYSSAADSSIRAALQNRSLTHDYFPHGGFIGAGYLDVPRALYDSPPPELYTALNPASNIVARALAAFT